MAKKVLALPRHRLRILSAVALIAIAAGLAATPAQAQEHPGGYLIQLGLKTMRIGPYRVHTDPSYAGALDAFGEATSCRIVRGDPAWAVATWAPLQIRIELVTFGGVPAGETGCTAPGAIHVSTIRATGRHWYTSLGLRVGDSAGRLKRLYTRAIPHRAVSGWYGAGYWLVTERRVCFGVCTTRSVTAPRLVAEVKNSRVSSFVLVVAAQGE